MCSKLGSWSFPGKHSKLRKRISLPHEPPVGCVVSWAPTLLDSELTELPGQALLWVSMAWEGAGAGSANVEVRYKTDVPSVLVCGTAFARPFVITPDSTEFELTFGFGSQPRFRELAL